MGLWQRAGQGTRADRRAARRALRAAQPDTAFVKRPEPRALGNPARGRHLLGGELLFAGHLRRLEGDHPWDLPAPSDGFAEALHGFGWLDDVAALGGLPARALAQRWLAEWLERQARARGVGWTPALAGRRLLRWIHHGPFLLAGPGRQRASDFFAVAAAHAAFLAQRWSAAPAGLPRFEALAGLLQAGVSLTGMEAHIAPAQAGLARDCDRLIDAEGALPGRNPEALLQVLMLLTWTAQALREAGHTPDPAHDAAILRIAPTLKALRHADGRLARFHGGDAGAPGALDLTLAEAGVRARPRPGRPMGFVRLASRRTTVIVDAAPPPAGGCAHASTLAFELTSGRRPVIVGCGAGAEFGPQWRRAARATAVHSTLALEGLSSARLPASARHSAADAPEPDFAERPGPVTLAREGEGHAAGVVLSHDGWARSHGLIHVRRLTLSMDGRALAGEDALIALTPAQRRRFAAVVDRGALSGVAFALHFHLHPEVSARLDPSGRTVTLTLRSGEVWVLRAEGALPLLAPSVQLETGWLHPRRARQIVLSARAMTPAQQISWTLAKAHDSPVGLRDIALEEGDAPPVALDLSARD